MRSDEVHMHYNGAIVWPLYVLILYRAGFVLLPSQPPSISARYVAV